MGRSRLSDRSVIGLLLVGLGTMFLLDSTNVFGPEVRIVGTYWPALLIAWAVGGFIANGLVFRWWLLVVGGVGVVFLLSNLGVWALGVGQLWPIALVALGLMMLLGRQVRRKGAARAGRASHRQVEA
jgi:hypothetical protein